MVGIHGGQGRIQELERGGAEVKYAGNNYTQKILPLATPTLVYFGYTVHVWLRARGPCMPIMGRGRLEEPYI